MKQTAIKQCPIVLFFLIVILCIIFNESRVLLLMIVAASLFWLAYAHRYSQFTFKHLFKTKKKTI